MNKIISAALLILAITIYSCNNSSSIKNTGVDTSLLNSSARDTSVTLPDMPTQNPQAGMPGQVITTAGEATQVPVTTTPVSSGNKEVTAAGMNPEHGKPGHRCDIAVGQPLSTPKAATSITPTTTTTTPVANKAPVTPTAPGMNPPHGEPGHDCSIGVGEPLKKP